MFAGHMRDWEDRWPAHASVAQLWNADVFIHTWDDLGNVVRPKDDPLRGPSPAHNGKLDQNHVVRTIKPKGILVENNREVIANKLRMDYDDYVYLLFKQAGIFSILSQLYSIQAVSVLRQQYEQRMNLRYDYVIRVRIDWQPASRITPVMLEQTSEHKSLAVPTARYACHGHVVCDRCLEGRHDGTHVKEVCDMFAYGRADAVDHACALYSVAGPVFASAVAELAPDPLQWEALADEGPYKRRMVPAKPISLRLDVPTFNPERLLMHHLAGYRLIESPWIGGVYRRRS